MADGIWSMADGLWPMADGTWPMASMIPMPSAMSRDGFVLGHPRAAAGFGERQPDRADTRLLVKDLCLRARRDLEQPARQLRREPRHDAKDAAGEVKGEGVAAHLQPRRDRPRREHELLGRAFEDSRRHRIAECGHPLHDRAERRDAHPRLLAIVEDPRPPRLGAH